MPTAAELHVLALVLVPGTTPLSRVLSTARSRGIRVSGAVYAEHAPGPARLQLEIAADRHTAERAVLVLSRVVDVLSARLADPHDDARSTPARPR